MLVKWPEAQRSGLSPVGEPREQWTWFLMRWLWPRKPSEQPCALGCPLRVSWINSGLQPGTRIESLRHLLLDTDRKTLGSLSLYESPPDLILGVCVSSVFCSFGKGLRACKEDRKGKFCYGMEEISHVGHPVFHWVEYLPRHWTNTMRHRSPYRFQFTFWEHENRDQGDWAQCPTSRDVRNCAMWPLKN